MGLARLVFYVIVSQPITLRGVAEGGLRFLVSLRSLGMTSEGFTQNDTGGWRNTLPEHHRESKHHRYGVAGVLAWGPFWGGGDCSYYFVVEVWVDASDYLYVGH